MILYPVWPVEAAVDRSDGLSPLLYVGPSAPSSPTDSLSAAAAPNMPVW